MSDDDLPQPKDGELPLPPGADMTKDGFFAPAPLLSQPGRANVYDPNAPVPQRPLGPGVHGPVAQNLVIEPSVLRGAAGKADEVYDTLHKQAASLEEPTSTAAKAVEGLQVEQALRRSHKHWEEQAGTVTAWIANISESLRLAASTHVAHDADRAATFGKKKPLLDDGNTFGTPSSPSTSRWGF